ncbi:H(+)-exporting diphosphatase [Plasmodiophora brassicae]|uniref:H(+)-exporting diphosphatase n=1 Tax=Plasmodiophora brassicae TaxID=37360 RepID=A0A0G4IQ90_PLABS|nr:hypothetical protein PBRA_000659 [Plasmodiophora brassicae]SPQ97620.1 unnamed protein product [Plasmodiophora brassicae]
MQAFFGFTALALVVVIAVAVTGQISTVDVENSLPVYSTEDPGTVDSIPQAVSAAGKRIPFHTVFDVESRVVKHACSKLCQGLVQPVLLVAGTLMLLAVAIAVVLPFIAMLAAAGGASVEALRTHRISYTNAAARQAVISAFASVGAAFGAQIAAAIILTIIFTVLPLRIASGVSKTLAPFLRVAGSCVSGMAASAANGQDVVIGAKCGSVYGAAMLVPQLWTQYCMPQDDNGKPDLSGRGCRCLNPLFWIDLGMLTSQIWIAILALFVSVPGYSHNMVGSGALMGLFGLGDIACIADKFPVPSLPPSN